MSAKIFLGNSRWVMKEIAAPNLFLYDEIAQLENCIATSTDFTILGVANYIYYDVSNESYLLAKEVTGLGLQCPAPYFVRDYTKVHVLVTEITLPFEFELKDIPSMQLKLTQHQGSSSSSFFRLKWWPEGELGKFAFLACLQHGV